MLIGRRARMQGFIILNYAARYGEAVEAFSKLIVQGKLKTVVDMQHGFDNIPATLYRLFKCKNIGKNCSR